MLPLERRRLLRRSRFEGRRAIRLTARLIAPCARSVLRDVARMDLDPEARRLMQAVRAHIDSLPVGERLNALLQFVAVMLDYLSRDQVLAIRAEMIATFGERQLGEALDLLDGHLALRELQGS